jgi:hypothetical protein
MNSAKTKKKQPSANVKPTSKSPWEGREKLPIGIFHTITGPIIGRVGKETKLKVVVYAPARLQPVSATKVLYHPIAFVEEHITLYHSAMLGDSPIPVVIAEGYQDYYKEFVKGSFTMAPILINAGVDGSKEAVDAMQHDSAPVPAEAATPAPPAVSVPFEEEEDKPAEAPPAAAAN